MRARYVLALIVAPVIAIPVLDRAGVIDVLPRMHVHLPKTTDTGRLLVPGSFDRIAAVDIVAGGASYHFERRANGQWVHVPEQTEAGSDLDAPATETDADAGESAAIERILRLFAGARVKKELGAGKDVNAKGYGVLRPQMTVTFYARGEPRPLVRYFIGDLSADGAGRYALIFGGFEMVLLPAGRVADLTWLADAYRPDGDEAAAARHRA